MRFTRAKSLAELDAMGFEPCSDAAATKFRLYGIPLYQAGLLPIEDTAARCFVPRWAARLINEWPLSALDSAGDFDHYLLKIVIRRVVCSGDQDFATAACAVAMLGGALGVTTFLEGANALLSRPSSLRGQ